MTRPSFSTTIPSSCHYLVVSGNIVAADYAIPVSDGRVSTEGVVGVSRRKPIGWVPPTPYVCVSRRLLRAVGVSRQIYTLAPDTFILYTGSVGGTVFDDTAHFDYVIAENELALRQEPLQERALIKARKDLKQSNVNLGVAFAERNATARLLGDTASNLARSVNHLKRGQVRKAMNDLGISSKAREPKGSNWPNKWLELQYGWKPFLSDVYGAAAALEKQPPSNFRVTAKGKVTEQISNFQKWEDFSAGTTTAKGMVGAFARIDAIPDNDLTMSLTSLGITNPLLVAWELVPYSFVVDWVYPIGGWLESLDALLGYSEASYSISNLIRCEWEETGSTVSYLGWNVINDYAGSKKFVSLVRNISNNVPLPTFPRIKDPRSLGHMANGLALLASAFGRGR